MERQAIKKTLEQLDGKISSVKDEHIQSIFHTLVNLVEALVDENERLKKANQKQKDEINRLKGEQGKPGIRKKTPDDSKSNDHSSEQERKSKKSSKKKKANKKDEIQIHRTVMCDVDKSTLPEDAVFKSYENVVMQDLIIQADNIQFRRAVYYSPSLKKTFSGKLPDGYHGDFGPGIRSLVLSLYHDSRMTQPAIKRFLNTMGISISKGSVSRMLTEKHDSFHQEKENIITAGLKSTDYQHIDDTGSRVKGKNQHVHILCNPYYTAYFSLPKKNRLGILELLCRGPLTFDLTRNSIELMADLGLAKKHIHYLQQQKETIDLFNNDLDGLLKQMFPNPKKHQSNRRIILEACAIVSYRKRDDAIKFFIADDAPQFKNITESLGLCWVHEGRHYKKLNPISPANRIVLDNFINQFWDFYKCLLDYKKNPTNKQAAILTNQFNSLFTPNTTYDLLNNTIKRTADKKHELLLVLTYPHLPLHNNDAELGARLQARIRDIHLHTMSTLGTKAKDTFSTISQTARKLGVNLYDYFHDRMTKKYQMPSLAQIILEKSSAALPEPG